VTYVCVTLNRRKKDATLRSHTRVLAQVASIVFSTVLSVYLYVSSFKKGVLLAEGGNTGWLPYDFWMGRELNPRIASFDLKVFCELRPGLIGNYFYFFFFDELCPGLIDTKKKFLFLASSALGQLFPKRHSL